MKPFQLSSALRFSLFLMLITSFTTAVAYDFESGGIYYNITSPNTVEVTYRDTNYNSYSGNVVIPSTVSKNGTTHTVTAIGDYAFYNSNDVSDLTIPETIESIGYYAFYGCYPYNFTCLAMEAPSLNGSFDESRYWIYDFWYTNEPRYILHVNSSAFDSYYNSGWVAYFNYTLTEEQTSLESISYDVYEKFSRIDGHLLHAIISVYFNGVTERESELFVSVNESGWTSYFDYYDEGYWGIYVDGDMVAMGYSTYHVDAVLVEYGKLPSEPMGFTYYAPSYSPDAYFDTYYSPYSMIVDGICYRIIDNNSVAVAPDVDIVTHHPLQWEGNDCECNCLGLYNGLISIPSKIEYNDKTYNVTSIDSYTFGNYGYYSYNMTKNGLYFDFSTTSKHYEGDFAFYYGTIDGRNLTSISLPNSISYIDWYAFDACDNLNYIHLTGEGEWSGGALNVAFQRLDIASGITAFPGMQVNPREVYCYAKVPPTCDENTFTDYTGTLHVPESSLAAYFTAPYWCNFANIVGDAVELQSISINKDNAELLIGEQINLNATLHPANANAEAIQWESSDPSIATVTNDGVVTAMALGECDIIATCLDKRDTCHVKVVEQIVTISLDQHHASILPNHILTLTPTVSPASTPLVVTSSNPSVAAARLTNGVVQVVGISAGTSVIKVASADDNAFADSCLVNVYTEVGDVDGDGFVKIDDVTTIIDYLLGGSASNFNAANADVDFDGDIDISDVTELIDHLLSGGTGQNERFMVNGVPFTMVRVAAGSFMMGATEEQGDEASSWEKPVHSVTLSSYMIGQTEVTQELWQAVMGTNPSLHSGSLQKPVENVSWDDCQAFITQLNALTGQHFRMPTEAEWEYAARGGNKSLGYKYAGSNNIDEVGWVTGTTTHPVGELQPNELGLYDMSGNVDEWVWDYFGYYTSEPQTDPTGPETGDNRMYRGGSWYGGANASRVSYRFFRAPTFKRGTMGLRLVL